MFEMYTDSSNMAWFQYWTFKYLYIFFFELIINLNCLQDILKDTMDNNLISVTQIPYFEGDFWPNILEECIKEQEQEELEKRRRKEEEEAADNDDLEPAGEHSVEVFKRAVWKLFVPADALMSEINTE